MRDQLTILVVDDNDLDVERIERAVRRLGLGNPVCRAADGIDALDCLRGTGDRQTTAPPRLVLLDLNMPRMTGIEFLEQVRSDPELAGLPIVVLSTSARPADREVVQNHGAIGYFVKPLRDQDLVDLIDRVAERGLDNAS